MHPTDKRIATGAAAVAAALACAGLLAAAALTTGASAAHAVPTAARGHDESWLDRLFGRRREVKASRIIPWSQASRRPVVGDGPGEGVYVWHDRNTVHVWFRSPDRRRVVYTGWVEIVGGKIDTLQDDRTSEDDEFRQATERRVLFKIAGGEGDQPRGFRFNIKGGERLIVQTEVGGRRIDRVYFGETMTDARGNPVTFDLRR